MTTDEQTARLQQWLEAHESTATDHDKRVIDIPDHVMLRATWERDFGSEW